MSVSQELQERSALLKVAKDVSTMPQTEKMVEALSILSDKDRVALKNYINFAVRVNGDVYFVSPKQMVPSQSSVIRSTTNQLLGIAPVSGG
jgi:hypothetical protein